MSAAEHLTAALAELRAGVEAIDENADLATLAEVAHLLDQVKDAASDARDLLHGALGAWMGEPTMPAGRFRLESHRGAKRKGVDSDALLSHLAGLARVDRETGVMRSDAERFDAFYDYVRRCVPMTRSLGWRTTALRDAGVDPQDWFEWEPGRSTVSVHLVDPDAGEAA